MRPVAPPRAAYKQRTSVMPRASQLRRQLKRTPTLKPGGHISKLALSRRNQHGLVAGATVAASGMPR